MVWLNSVVSVPLIGVAIRPSFSTVFRFGELLAPFLENERALKHDVSLSMRNGSVEAAVSDGFTYKLLPDTVIVEFAYVTTELRGAGQPPKFLDIEPRKFSDLLNEMVKKTDELIQGFPNRDELGIHRLGIVAKSQISPELAPPGVQKFVEFLGAPFGGTLTKADVTLVADIESSAEWTDRCHHAITFDKGGSLYELGLALDWQRKFTDTIKPEQFSLRLQHSAKAAVDYFERVGVQGVGNA